MGQLTEGNDDPTGSSRADPKAFSETIEGICPSQAWLLKHTM